MGAFVVGADVLGGPRPRGRPMRAACRGRPRVRGAPRTSRPTSWCISDTPESVWVHCGYGDVYGRGRRPRRPASLGASPCARRGRSLCAARRGRRALPAGASRTYRGRHGRIVVTGVFMVGADVPGGPRARGRFRWRPRARGAPRTSRPTSRCIPDPPRSAWAYCGQGVFMVGADVPAACVHWGRPRVRGVGVSCARRAEDVAPYQPVHPGPTEVGTGALRSRGCLW